jgi:hypothetical protein
MNEREPQVLIVNGAGLLIGSILVGWVFFFFLVKAAVLWPIPGSIPLAVPGDERGWRMAHMEGLTQGLLLLGIGAIGGQLRLSRGQSRVLMWSSIVTGWLFFLPAAFGPMAGVRGLAFGGGPFGGDVTLNNLMYVFGWPPMIAVHLMLPLLFWGALQRLRELG